MSDAIANQTWDAVVIGAGPAGGVSALLLARRGWRVLLLDRASWPRTKVCGGCINASAVAMLREIGLGHLVHHAPALDRCSIRSGDREALLHLPAGAAVVRKEFDSAIVRAFCEAGGTFVDRASATVLETTTAEAIRAIAVRIDGEPQNIFARVVLACDGISGTSIEREPWAAWRVAPDAWFGVAATLPAEAIDVDAGRIEMRTARGGYVGLVREAAGTIHLAAALDPAVCKSVGGPEAFVRGILNDCGHANVNFDGIRFTGTGLLTRKRIGLGGHRVLAVGDACGYVEPFTGEGVAWAIRSAIEVADLVASHDRAWMTTIPKEWERRHRMSVGRQQRACRMIRYALHRPWIARSGIAAATWVPRAADVVAGFAQSHGKSIHGPVKAYA